MGKYSALDHAAHCETPSPREPIATLEAGELVTETEAAAILNAAVGTLRNWRALGKGPRVYKIGERLCRYRRADLVAFIAGSAGKAAA